MTLAENAKPRAYFSNQAGMEVAPYVLQLPDAKYDIGLYPAEGGGYEARTDFWGGSVEKVLGVQACSVDSRDQAKMGKLYQYYALNAAEEQAIQQGYQTRRVAAEDGAIHVAITGTF